MIISSRPFDPPANECASFNRIGTDGLKGPTLDAKERNLIAGNNLDGIYLEDAVSNVIAGNYIGTDVTGAAALAALIVRR